MTRLGLAGLYLTPSVDVHSGTRVGLGGQPSQHPAGHLVISVDRANLSEGSNKQKSSMLRDYRQVISEDFEMAFLGKYMQYFS